jgi:hypothetical protein
MRLALVWFVGALCGAAIALGVIRYRSLDAGAPPLTTDYQLVLLDNGQAFFGRLERFSASYSILRDVYYIQSQVDPETKQSKNTLVKRGREWHEPDSMIVDARHIVLVEPVSPTSTVAKLIKEFHPQ